MPAVQATLPAKTPVCLQRQLPEPPLTCGWGRTHSRSCSSWGSRDGHSPASWHAGQLANTYRNQKGEVKPQQEPGLNVTQE